MAENCLCVKAPLFKTNAADSNDAIIINGVCVLQAKAKCVKGDSAREARYLR
jgi:hypothetical protein